MAASGPQKHLTLDTNILLDLAEPKDSAHDFRETFQNKGYSLWISRTVVAELDALTCYGNAHQQDRANRALEKLWDWRIKPFDPSSVGQVIAEQFAKRLIAQGLIPEGEFNDGLILAETSLAEIPLLVTSDKHLLDIDETELRLAFHDADLAPVSPVHPKRLLRAIR